MSTIIELTEKVNFDTKHLLQGVTVSVWALGVEAAIVFILSQPTAHSLQLSDVVRYLLDGVHLLLQVVGLKEIAHLKKSQNIVKNIEYLKLKS